MKTAQVETKNGSGKAAVEALAPTDVIVLRLTVQEVGMLRSAIDITVRNGGMVAAKQLLALDAKLEHSDEK